MRGSAGRSNCDLETIMKTLMTTLLAGAMTVSVMNAGVNDQSAEERYRAKYGRYTPAEEARRANAEQVKRQATQRRCGDEGCCRHTPAAYAERVSPGARPYADASERMKAKFGRSLDKPA